MNENRRGGRTPGGRAAKARRENRASLRPLSNASLGEATLKDGLSKALEFLDRWLGLDPQRQSSVGAETLAGDETGII